MKKKYKAPALRESELKVFTLLTGSLGVNPEKTSSPQLSKQNSIFDSVFGSDDEVEE